ncbi:MAG: hypothetical protein ABJC24_10505 [Chloroflexota bacterium]
MTRRPFQHGEADGLGADLEPTVADLERYRAESAAEPSRGFADRVVHMVESEPIPRRGVLAWLATAFSSERGRMALMAATVAVAVLAVLATGQLARLMPSQFGGTPQPSQSIPASPDPSLPVSSSPSPTVSPSPSESPSADPSASDSDDDSGLPDASDDPDESPSPTDDNSGPGGGDGIGGNSGPGGGSSSPEAGY